MWCPGWTALRPSPACVKWLQCCSAAWPDRWHCAHGGLCRSHATCAARLGRPVSRALASLVDFTRDGISRWKQLVTAATVCRALRNAVLGPGAGPLWRDLTFSSTHPGLNAGQSRQLSRLLASQGQHARYAVVVGGGWDLDELRAVAASLTGQLRRLELDGLYSADEAEILSSVLPACRVERLICDGMRVPALPTSLKGLELYLKLSPERTLEEVLAFTEQARTRQALQQLRPLTQLTYLRLAMAHISLSTADIALISDSLPRLEVFTLSLQAGGDGPEAVEALASLRPSVQLGLLLSASDGSLTALLQELPGLQLSTLNVAVYGTYSLRPADEALLAQCSIAEQLTLVMQSSEPAERLQRLLPGVKVLHILPS